MINLKLICDFLEKNTESLSDFNFRKYMSILCIIVLITFVGLDKKTLLH